MAQISPSEWERFLEDFPDSHLLQSPNRGVLKSEFGWQVYHLASQDCGAQILVKQILPSIRFAYIPKGPVGSGWERLWPDIDALCRRLNCVFLKIEPDQWIDDENSPRNPMEPAPDGFIPSQHSIQPRRTLLIDIAADESDILVRMKQKTRYNINLAIKKNVVIKPQTNLGVFYDLMEVTGQRDQFGIHSQAYYQRAFDLFNDRQNCQLLLAEYEGTPLAALIVFKNGNRAWYFYGASSNVHRDKMPNYLLQWEAIRWAKRNGCSQYDLWGVPDEELATLEADFSKKSTGLWGVYRFKRGFGGELKKSKGPWDRVYNPLFYRLYLFLIKYRKSEG
jgi:lipid II:glycine glycyltransferase (peptidoglycan interpeptide bridge formation enzyme)